MELPPVRYEHIILLLSWCSREVFIEHFFLVSLTVILPTCLILDLMLLLRFCLVLTHLKEVLLKSLNWPQIFL